MYKSKIEIEMVEMIAYWFVCLLRINDNMMSIMAVIIRERNGNKLIFEFLRNLLILILLRYKHFL